MPDNTPKPPSSVYTIKTTSIPGLLEIDITLMEDARGWFQEKYQRAKLIEQGFPSDFVALQQSLSYNREVGVTRGFHAEPWDKYIGVISGRVFCVYVDLRKDNFGTTHTVLVDPTKTVYVPRGVANSFQTLEADTYYSYLVNDHWSADKLDQYKFANLADPTLKIDWPIAIEKAIISDRDKNHPMLKDVKPF